MNKFLRSTSFFFSCWIILLIAASSASRGHVQGHGPKLLEPGPSGGILAPFVLMKPTRQLEKVQYIGEMTRNRSSSSYSFHFYDEKKDKLGRAALPFEKFKLILQEDGSKKPEVLELGKDQVFRRLDLEIDRKKIQVVELLAYGPRGEIWAATFQHGFE